MVRWGLAGLLLLFATAGCGEPVVPRGRQFALPLMIEGRLVGSALIDTGAESELILQQPYGLEVVSSVPVILFDGSTIVPVTAPFSYTLAGIDMTSPGAIVRSSACGCDAVGADFFRRSGRVAMIDYRTGATALVGAIPHDGYEVPLAPGVNPTSQFFNSARVSIQVNGDRFVDAILDTGANVSAIRTGLARSQAGTVRLTHHVLGTISVPASQLLPFNTPGLPDLILGTDTMPLWGNVWYFAFGPQSGRAVVFRLPERAEVSLDTAEITSSGPILQSPPSN